MNREADMGHGDQIAPTRQTRHKVRFKLAEPRSVRHGPLDENTTYLISYHGKRLVGSDQQTFICHAAHSR